MGCNYYTMVTKDDTKIMITWQWRWSSRTYMNTPLSTLISWTWWLETWMGTKSHRNRGRRKNSFGINRSLFCWISSSKLINLSISSTKSYRNSSITTLMSTLTALSLSLCCIRLVSSTKKDYPSCSSTSITNNVLALCLFPI